MELYGSMTAYENVALGAESARIGGNPLRQLIGSRRDRFRVAADTEAAIELCGLGPVRDHRVDGLSTGWRRLTELARACAGGYRLLLLDEPSSGLDHRETESVSRILRSLVEVKHLGILLVEHDMALVMSVCANIFVLDFGVLIFTGTPQQVQADPTVRSAYLGSEEGLEEAQAREEAAEQGRCRQLDDATAGRS